MEFKLRNGGVTIIDEEDLDRISKHKWRKSDKGYVIGYIPSIDKQIYLHRFILCIENIGREIEVDHKNRNPLDNRKENLRLCSRSENLVNTKARNKNGYKGVYLRKDGMYEARISVLIGVFDDIKKAADAFENESIKRYGIFAKQE